MSLLARCFLTRTVLRASSHSFPVLATSCSTSSSAFASATTSRWHSTAAGGEGEDASEEEKLKQIRRAKLKALYGVDGNTKKSSGKAVTRSSQTTVEGESDDAIAAWTQSGYVDYMENQRKEGWKT